MDSFMGSFLLIMVTAVSAIVILIIVLYRTKVLGSSRGKEVSAGKEDSVGKAVNLTVQAPGQNSRASIQGVTTYQVEGDLVINPPGQVAGVQSAGVPTEGEYEEHPTLEEIRKEIKELPVFQRSLVMKSYIGLKVHWLLTFLSIHERPESVFSVTGQDSEKVAFADFDVDISKHPEFKIMREGHRMWVSGEIADIEYGCTVFKLSNCLVKVE